MRFSILVPLIALMLLIQPVSADFPVSGTYLSLSSGVAEPYSKFDGKFILLEAFATWCEPCLHEMHELSLLNDVYGSDGSGNLTILSISVSPRTDNLEKIQNFKLKAENLFGFKADWEFGMITQARSNEQSFTSLLNISAIPTILLINQDGSITHKWQGGTSANDISAFINANVTFPESNSYSVIVDQLLGNTLFQFFMVGVLITILFRLIIPKPEVT